MITSAVLSRTLASSGFLEDGVAVGRAVAVGFFLMLFARFLEISADFRFVCRFTIDLYIKIVVIVNAVFSVDKSLFFNRIKRLHQK